MKIRLAIILFTLIISAGPISAQTTHPFAGAALPVGSSSSYWSPGWSAGIEIPISQRRGLDWSATISASRNEPNAERLLRTSGRNLTIEHQQGWSMVFGLSLAASRTLIAASNDGADFRAIGGVGIYYLHDSEVFVGGFYPDGATAINRQRRIEAQTLAAPGISIGCAGKILNNIEPSLMFSRIFVGGSPRDLLSINVGLLPR